MTRLEILAEGEAVREALEALVRWCQRHKKAWPPRVNLARHFKMTTSAVDYHMDQLIKSGRVRRLKAGQFEVPNLSPLEVQ